MTEAAGKFDHRTDRRTFLKTSGFLAASTILDAEGRAAEMAEKSSDDSEQTAAAATSGKIDLVNVLQGTNSSYEYSRGNTLPIAALPFGMAHWTLQSHSDTPWFFRPDARRIQGFRCTHQLSPWLDDYGHATFLPFCGDVDPAPAERGSSFICEASRLTPYSFQMYLPRYRTNVELIPTERCAILKAGFENEKSAVTGLIIDVADEDRCFEADSGNLRVRFATKANAGGVPDNFRSYYVVEFSTPHTGLEVKQLGKHQVGVVRFGAGKAFEARIGTSFISYEQAALNLSRELSKQTIESVRAHAKDCWNQHLGVIEVEGGSKEERKTFYSCMYRTLLFPRIWHEPDAHGELHHFSAYNGKVMPGVMYADHGYWDLYRAWYPMMSILFPQRLGEILQGWVNAYKEGGWLPQFPAPGYRSCMTGSLIDAVFADAAVKGITGFDLARAYEGMKKHATEQGDPARGFGRVGLEHYLKHHYVPANLVPQSAAETADAAYGDFCIAQIAAVLGYQKDCDAFMARARNWRNLFDPKTKFLRGKNEDGSWATPFDPTTWGSPYVEGAAWQHRWDCPHDIPQLIDEMGGNEAAVKALEQMLASPADFNVGVYGREIHEMSEMAAVPFGQYAHSNQPVHHLLYLFAEAGRPDLTQFWVRKVMKDLYSPDDFAGDEDTGSMSAWFIMSALGLYPVCPGKAEYTLGSPLFTRAKIELAAGKCLVIEAPGNASDAVYVQNVSMSGKPLGGPRVGHAELMAGGTLRFSLSSSKRIA